MYGTISAGTRWLARWLDMEKQKKIKKKKINKYEYLKFAHATLGGKRKP